MASETGLNGHLSADLFRNLFNLTNDGVLLLDDAGRFADVNPSFCRMAMTARERLIGTRLMDLVPPGRTLAELKSASAGPIEFPLQSADGSAIGLEWTCCTQLPSGLSLFICRDKTESQRARAALLESEERQRRAVQAGGIGLWEWDIAKNRVAWSDHVYDLHGVERGSFDGTVEAFAAIVDPRDRERVSEALQNALAGEGDYHIEFRPARPDGKQRWLETSGRVTFDSNGRPAMMHGAVVDTTARREAEEAQRETERQLLLLVEASSALLASPQTADVLRTITELAQRFVSADAYAVWRLHDDDVWQLRSSSGLSGEFVTSLASARGGHLLTVEPMVIEDCTHDPRCEARREVLEREGVRSMLVVPLLIQNRPSGTVVFYWKSPHNITQSEIRIASALGNLAAAALGTAEIYERQLELRGEAESAEKRATFLAEAGAVLSSSLDYVETLSSVARLAIPVFADWASVDVIGPEGGVQRVAITHKDPRKISLAREFAKSYPPRPSDAAQVALRSGKSLLIEVVSDAMIEEGARDAEHLRLLRELGLKSVIIAPMVFNGRSLGVITFVTAESERHYRAADLQTAEELARRAAAALENSRLYHESKQTQAELQIKNEDLRRANDDLNQFAYSASHDLQEPLRMVSIYSQLLKRKYAEQLDATAEKYLSYAVEGALRMETLLRDILAYTQVANTDTVPPAAVDAGAVLRKALANLQSAISESGALIHTGELPAVRVQEVHLLQLFQNIIGNAIKYRKGKGLQIEVAASLECDRWLFSVADNGIGIDAQYKEQIFGLFKRLHSTEDYPGTGVGLAICQKIVERYRGRIWVDSEPGRGSTFFFTLPAGS